MSESPKGRTFFLKGDGKDVNNMRECQCQVGSTDKWKSKDPLVSDIAKAIFSGQIIKDLDIELDNVVIQV